MAKTVPVIGLDPGELPSIRLLVRLLRHPDPIIPELTRQALLYLIRVSERGVPTEPATQYFFKKF